MDPTPDELAGVVDVFGALTRDEIERACAELAFKRGDDDDPSSFTDSVESAIASYHLVAVADHDAAVDGDLLAVGPTAFPELPDGAGDLPHIMDVPERDLKREVVAAAVEERFREDAVVAVKAGDDDRIADLLDISYDLEAWGPVSLSAARDRLDDA